MALQDRLTVVIDFVTGPAQSGLGKLRNEVRQAEGAMGKMKAGAGALGGMLATNVAGAAVAAAGAIAAFGVKSVRAFQDTALAAGRFADATGVSVESASRLIEVAGDLGIGADSVQSAIMRMNVAIDKNKPAIKGMRDAIVLAKDGTVDSAASFQNLVTRIGAIPDATERARVAQEVFGRGYGDIAEMMSMSAAQLKASLAGVSDQQVIDEAELAKARKFRDSLDALSDKVNGLMMDLGEDLVPVVTDVTDAIVSMADKFGELSDVFEDIAGSGLVDFFSPLDNIASGLSRVFGDNVSNVDRFKGGLEVITSILPGVGEKVSEWADESERLGVSIEHGTEQSRELARIYGERVPPAVDKSTTHVEDLEAATEEAKKEAERLEQQWQDLFDEIAADKATHDLEQSFKDLEKAALDAWVKTTEGAEDAAEAQAKYEGDLIALKEETARYAKEVLGLPRERVTEILAMLDAGEADKVERQLATLARYREAQIRPRIVPDRIDRLPPQPPAGVIPIEGKLAAGGPMRAGKAYLVGEKGPEVVVPGQAGTVIPNHRLGSTAIGGAPMVINITTSADPESVVEAIERYRRRNGSLPF